MTSRRQSDILEGTYSKGEIPAKRCQIPIRHRLGPPVQIRKVRSMLRSLLYSHGGQLDDESPRNFMVEAEAVVNSHPLNTDDSSCMETPDMLTPNHLLTQKSQVVLKPPGVFQRAETVA